MNYWIHPEAAAEHQQQVAYYEEAQPGLGRRYREVDGVVQVLAVAHHRRQPGFWRGRF